MILKKRTACLLIAALLLGCDGALKVPKGEETKFLFSLKSAQSLGDGFGNLAMIQDNIYIHPGKTTATSGTFNLDGKVRSITIKPFIGKLNEVGEKMPEAGIVGFETIVDGKSIGKITVDRNTAVEKALDVRGVKSLEFRVDNGNGTPAFDWFMIHVISLE
jgi:hypothetical protein